MKKLMASLCLALCSLTLIASPAEAAKRLGGGKSIGMQRDNVGAKPASPPPQQAAPTAGQATPSPAAGAPKRNWLGPLAGLAAGIGLAALLSHFGLGEGMANVLMIVLLAMAAVFVFRLLFKRPATPDNQADPMRYAGVGGPNMAPPPQVDSHSANPGVTAPVPGMAGSTGSAAPRVPADFDVDAFIRVAKVQFVRMRAAHDAGNIDDIREFTTPEMFAEIKLDVDERKGATQQTEVLSVDAEVLEVASEATRHIASVRFRGSIREEQGAAPVAFDEVWNLVKPVSGGGWLLAGVQQLN